MKVGGVPIRLRSSRTYPNNWTVFRIVERAPRPLPQEVGAVLRGQMGDKAITVVRQLDGWRIVWADGLWGDVLVDDWFADCTDLEVATEWRPL